MHLAELNISKWKINPASHDAMGFVRYVARVNGAAERSDGFVWRLLDEERNVNGRNAVCEDNDTVMTLSTWESAEQLEKFVWGTVHKKIYNGKDQWFAHMESHHLAMWWVDEGHHPTLEEAKERLDHLDIHGDTDHAFGWSHLPHVKLWQEQRCG